MKIRVWAEKPIYDRNDCIDHWAYLPDGDFDITSNASEEMVKKAIWTGNGKQVEIIDMDAEGAARFIEVAEKSDFSVQPNAAKIWKEGDILEFNDGVAMIWEINAFSKFIANLLRETNNFIQRIDELED